MKKIPLFLLGLFVFSFTISNSSYGAETTRHVTPDGHEFWLYPIKGAKRGAVAISWPSGLAGLPAGQEMLPRIGIDMMLNGGAAGKAPEDIIADFEDLDGGSRLFVQPEEIRGFIVAPNSEMMTAASIANDVLSKPTMGDKWFVRERDNLLKNSKGRDVNIVGMAWNLSREILMGDHPNKNYWSLRTTENIKAIKIDTVRNWQKAAFVGKGLTIAAAGSSKPQEVAAAIDKALAGLPKQDAPSFVPMDELKYMGKTIVFHAPDAPKSMILIIGKLPPATANQDLNINISLGVLGYGTQSRLFKAVRTGLRASYGFGAGFFDYTKHNRVMRLSGEVETAKLQEALETVAETYEEFRTDGIGIIEFPFARRFYRQRVEGALKKPTDATYLLLESKLNGGPKNDLQTLAQRIDDLERGKVNHYISQTFQPFDRLLKIVVTPDADAVKGDCLITKLDDWVSCR